VYNSYTLTEKNMNYTDEVLHKGSHTELRVRRGDNVNGYEYIHEHRCDGHIVSMLPVHPKHGMMIRKELTPCWGEGPFINSITGGWERDIHPTPIDTVVAELREETGIVLHDENVIKSLGTVRGTKSSDTMYHLFLIDLSDDNYEELEPEPDSELEKHEYCEWTPSASRGNCLLADATWIWHGSDPMLYVMYTRWVMGLYTEICREDYRG
jgi:hypothetical protein